MYAARTKIVSLSTRRHDGASHTAQTSWGHPFFIIVRFFIHVFHFGFKTATPISFFVRRHL
jgi:hypothetical protein